MHHDKCIRSDGDYFCAAACTHDRDERLRTDEHRANEFRRVVEMWAHYRFCCSDTPSPEKLDRMLRACDDATTLLVDEYGFKFKESELFKP